MTVGIFLHGRRPKSKAELKRYLASDEFDPFAVQVEATSMFGNEFDGSLDLARRSLEGNGVVFEGGPVFKSGTAFVGPDPYTSRKFYGQLHFKDGKWKVT